MLENIAETSCPVCGSEVASETRRAKHTNGYFNEIREFDCGHSLHFSPNFMMVLVKSECRKSSDMVKLTALRVSAKTALDGFIDGLDVDDEFKVKVKNSYKQIQG